MADKYIPRPENRREFMNKLITPYDETVGNPNSVYSIEIKPGEVEFNRGNEISQAKDTARNVSIGIKDIDEAIMYYFDNKLKLSVMQNNTRINVPVIYGSPERWKAVQADGYYRDATGKVQAPLVIYRRDSIQANRDLGNKLDGNRVNNLILVKKQYSRRNIYDSFDILSNRQPETEYTVAFPPDYVTINYNCIVYTNFVEQMDKIIESINFASNSYWGDPGKFQFKTRIDTFSNQIVLEQGSDRIIKSSFDMILNGYLIPDSVNRELASVNRTFGSTKILFGMEIVDTEREKQINKIKPKMRKLSSVIIADSTNVIVQNNIGVPTDTITYITTNTQILGEFINDTTILFNKGWLPAPEGFPETSINNFTILCNGLLVENTAIESFTQNNGTTILVINVSELGYSFSNSDEIIAIGKFLS
jgi:hypothetical protein